MPEWIRTFTDLNLISILIVVIILGSFFEGARKGASGSARHLLILVAEGIVTLLSIVLAWKFAEWAGEPLKAYLVSKQIVIPKSDIPWAYQLYLTFITGLRDFSLMRSGILFLLGYAVAKHVIQWLLFLWIAHWRVFLRKQPDGAPRTWTSTAAGGIIGCVTGVGRALMMIALLFIFTTLFPQTPFTEYLQKSEIYQRGATEVIQPFTGDFITKQLPVLTRSVGEEFNNILQRKYEVLDANIPNELSAAAKEVTAQAKTDEEKAQALYKWVGTRVVYDWDKVKLYEDQRIWKEQTPEDTFRTRKGVCIDYSRLYAVMARSVGLEVKVVTGLGYDGHGGYGSHAWNEVFVADKKEWIPLDSTWLASGGNWFNPPNFNETHIKDKV